MENKSFSSTRHTFQRQRVLKVPLRVPEGPISQCEIQLSSHVAVLFPQLNYLSFLSFQVSSVFFFIPSVIASFQDGPQ